MDVSRFDSCVIVNVFICLEAKVTKNKNNNNNDNNNDDDEIVVKQPQIHVQNNAHI